MRRVFVKQVWSRLVGHLYLAADVLVWNDHRVAVVGPHRVEMWRKNNLHTIGVPERSAWKNSDSFDRESSVSSWKAHNNYVPELGTICYVPQRGLLFSTPQASDRLRGYRCFCLFEEHHS